MKKEEFYKGIKAVGLVTFIPVVLITGPLGGYLLGDFLVKKFNLSGNVLLIFIGLGFFISIKEVIRIIRVSAGIDKKT